MIDTFILNAAMAGVLVALIAGPLGCMIIWRKMAFFGDTLSHAALLGVALGLIGGIDPMIGIIATGLLIAVALTPLSNRAIVSSDTILALISHTTLAVGVIAVSFRDDIRFDLMSYLFGDILAVTENDLWIIAGACAVAAVFMIRAWPQLLLVTVSEEIAQAEGIRARRTRLALLITLALLVAVAVKVVGLLLITALLIIPAVAARANASNPEMMAAMAAVTGGLAVLGGLGVSFQTDTPTGPTIVAVAAVFCGFSYAVQKIRKIFGN